MDFQEYWQTSPVSVVLLALIVLASIAAFNNPQMHRRWMLHPYSIAHRGKWETVFTSAFVHADTAHLLFNGLAFFFFGFALEKAMSSFPFALLYLCGILFSDITTILRHKDDPSYYALGASGAISAIIAASAIFFPLSEIYLFFIPIGIPAWLFAPLYILFSWYAAKKQMGNIGHEVHMWGAITGLVVPVIFWLAGLVKYTPQAIRIIQDNTGL